MKLKAVNLFMYYNIETTEEEKKCFLNTFHKNKKSVLDDRVFKLHDYKFKNGNILKEDINV